MGESIIKVSSEEDLIFRVRHVKSVIERLRTLETTTYNKASIRVLESRVFVAPNGQKVGVSRVLANQIHILDMELQGILSASYDNGDYYKCRLIMIEVGYFFPRTLLKLRKLLLCEHTA